MTTSTSTKTTRKTKPRWYNMHPVRQAELFGPKIGGIHAWLTRNGAEVLQPTSEWEVLRFRANDGTHIVYRKAVGTFTAAPKTVKVLDCFLQGESWSSGTKKYRGKAKTDVNTLLERDGDGCFLCWLPLGDDITVEHLCSVVHGGSNHIANKALAHAVCNAELGHCPVMEKIKMREMRKPCE